MGKTFSESVLKGDIALQGLIQEGGYEASLITTYSVFPPFYEEYVLPRLRSAGSRYNVVVADAGEFSKALGSREGQSLQAGAEYVFFPVRSAGSFHPKVILLVGRGKCALAVGSHNLTLSGFGYNRELTTLIRFKPAEDKEGVQLARSIWSTLKQWLANQQHVPRDVHDAVARFVSFAGWLEGDVSVQGTASLQFYAQTMQTRSLWDQVRPNIPSRVRRIVLVGPFFDSSLTLLDEISQAFQGAEIFVGIDPGTVEMPKRPKLGPRVHLRDASKAHRATGYLHAKALYFETVGDQDLLVIGSANPSAPAWLGSKGGGNQEAIVVHRGPSAREIAESTGLADIPALPRVPLKDLEVSLEARIPIQQGPAGPRLVVAAEVEDGLAIPKVAFAGATPEVAELYAKTGEMLARTEALKTHEGNVLIPISGTARRDASRVLLRAASGVEWLALIHRTAAIRNLAQSGKQTKLKEALSGLGGNTENLGKLIATIESVIFEEPEVARSAGRAKGNTAKENQDKGSERPGSLEISIDSQRKRPHRRIREDGDLAYLLDALLRQLGVGLERQQASVDGKGRTEQEQVGQDDAEEPPEPTPAADDAAIAEFCRSKVRRVVARLAKQLDKVAEGKSTSPTILLQLVAVLALLRELRAIEKNPRWHKIHESLVNRDDLDKLLVDILAYLFSKKYQLYKAITSALGDERFDELARMKGLLIWLAWECDVNLSERFSTAEEPKEVERRVQDKAALLEFAMIVQGDSLAQAEAAESIMRAATSGRATTGAAWLAVYSRWADRVTDAVRKLQDMTTMKIGPLRSGDLAVITTTTPLRPRVVASATSQQVSLVDFGKKRTTCTTINYEPNRVARVQV